MNTTKPAAKRAFFVRPPRISRLFVVNRKRSIKCARVIESLVVRHGEAYSFGYGKLR